MRGGVDAAGETGSNEKAFKPELGGKLHDRAVGKIEPAFGIEERRRRINMGERRWIALLSHDHEMGTGALGGLKLGLGLSLGENPDRGAAAAAEQSGQGVERCLGAAELID